ncbi:MAG TPA: hypothetical protein VF788_19520 [Pseudonocardiaceae bacterium]|jgi:uridine phosphorylase
MGALAAHHLEQLIAEGGRGFVVCGGAGAVQPQLAQGHVIAPVAAARDKELISLRPTCSTNRH